MTSERTPSCLVCDSPRLRFLYTSQGYRIDECAVRDLRFQNPQPSDAVLAAIYTAEYPLGE